jgi:hypothetical protein
MPEKRYIGDGVYVQHNGMHLVLTTEDGISATNTIYLEGSVWEQLKRFVAELRDGEEEEDDTDEG